MEAVKKVTASVKSNLIGGIAGGVGAWWLAGKYGKIENKWAKGGIALLGVIVGAFAQSKISAKVSKPTSATVTGK